jgi:hypothetical protein
VRPCGFPRGRHQDASKSASTTDVSRHEHPSKHHLRRLSAERRGKTRRRSPSRSSSVAAFPRFAEEDAGPPCGHPASDSRALDGALPASGPSTATLVALSRRVGRALLPCRRGSDSVDGDPLTPPLGRLARGLPEQPSHTAWTRCHRVHVNATGFPESEVPSTGGDPRERPCESSTGSAATLAGEAAAARLHRCSRTSTRPLDRSLS